jgi:hypothetical protein
MTSALRVTVIDIHPSNHAAPPCSTPSTHLNIPEPFVLTDRLDVLFLSGRVGEHGDLRLGIFLRGSVERGGWGWCWSGKE